MRRLHLPIHFALLLIVPLGLSSRASAQIRCHFPKQYPTIASEMKDKDVVVIASLREHHPEAPLGVERQPVAFETALVIKGDKLARPKQLVRAECGYSEAAAGERFLIMATSDSGALTWDAATRLTPAGEGYIVKLTQLPADGKERYLFFQSHLEHQDDVVAHDAYEELWSLPYAKLREMRDQMPHDSLVSWIQAKETRSSHRRLYLQMLGVCGKEQDVPMLEKEIAAADPKNRGLEAVISCFLSLRGNAGMKLVEERFLTNKTASYPDIYAATMALRFHARQEKIIHRDDLLRGFHFILDRPEIADLIIPDLVQLEDWEQAEHLAEMFKTADVKNTWFREPVINYLRACPLPIADKLLRECEQLDPKAAKAARQRQPVVEKKPLRVAEGK